MQVTKRMLDIEVIFFALMFISACQSREAGDVIQRENEPDVYFVESEDPEMLAAIQEAKDTFHQFEDYLLSGRLDLVSFSVKAGFPYPGDPSAVEHIWLYDISLSEDKVLGRIGNEPLDVIYLSLHEEVTVGLEDISDWVVIDDDGRFFWVHNPGSA